ncbi:MAG TPA: hypothetical protein VJ925_09710 [Longimicrobiales bacterium]|nr:hypothetical protein [Longimicrobiales bacterium]
MSRRAVRSTIKFLHTMGAVGFIGAIAALLVLHASLPEPTDLERFTVLRTAMGNVARWLLLPSMATVVCSGLLSMAVVSAYQSAGWAWAKLLSGIIILEGTLVYVQAPMERAAERAAAAMAGDIPVSELGTTLQPEWGSFWVIGGVAVANVALGVWRPRLTWGGSGSGTSASDTPTSEEGRAPTGVDSSPSAG